MLQKRRRAARRRLVVERLEQRIALTAADDGGMISGMFEIKRDDQGDHEEVRGSGVKDVDFHTYLTSDFVIPAGEAVSPENDRFERTVHAEVVCNVTGVAYGLRFQVFTESSAGGIGASEFNNSMQYGGELARAQTNLAFDGQWAIYVLDFDMRVLLTETAISETSSETGDPTIRLEQIDNEVEAGISGRIIARGPGASGGVVLSANLADLWFKETYEGSPLDEHYWENTASANISGKAQSFFVRADGYASVFVNSVVIDGVEMIAIDSNASVASLDVIANMSRDSFFSATTEAKQIGFEATHGGQTCRTEEFMGHSSVYNPGRWSTRTGTVGAGTLHNDQDDFATTRLRPRSNDQATTVDKVFTVMSEGEEIDALKIRGLNYLVELENLF